MSGLYNFMQNLDPNFNIMAAGFKGPTANVGGGYPGGQTNMTPQPMNPGGANKAMGQGTNGQVKITVSTRTTDQKKINSGQLCFIDTTNFNNPVLYGLQEVNRLIVQGSTPRVVKEDINGITFDNKMGPMDDKKKIVDTFKLLGVVSNNDVDTDVLSYKNTMSYDRGPRTFTIVTWGDSFLLNYWSNKEQILRPYDDCFLVLKKVDISGPEYSFQSDLTQSRHDIPTHFDRPIDYSRSYWQWVPISTRGEYPKNHIVNEFTQKSNKGNNIKQVELGTYLRVGKVHEYADVGNHKNYSKRSMFSVSRDVTYLHGSGKVRPFQFYLHLDDETKLI